MIERYLKNILLESLNSQAATVLLGPRQVGKTTLAFEISQSMNSLYLDLESPLDLNKLSSPELYFKQNQDKLLILDEIQRVPDLFPILRGIIDERRRQGNKFCHFLLLGSASLDLLKQSSESLAGRITQLELCPLGICEIQKIDPSANTLWLRGGFPDSFTANSDKESLRWRLDFIKTYLERDIPLLGPKIPAETLRRLWTMLAHLQASPVNASQLATNLLVSSQTIGRYIDLLVDLLLVRRLQPYHANVNKRLVKSPKIYIRDSGLCHALLGIQDMESLLENPVVGASYEGFIIENCINYAPPHTQFFYYRTQAGAEMDLLLELPNKEIWAIEIKRSLAPKVSKGFYQAITDVKPDKSFVVYPGTECYPLNDHTNVIGANEFINQLKQL